MISAREMILLLLRALILCTASANESASLSITSAQPSTLKNNELEPATSVPTDLNISDGRATQSPMTDTNTQLLREQATVTSKMEVGLRSIEYETLAEIQNTTSLESGQNYIGQLSDSLNGFTTVTHLSEATEPNFLPVTSVDIENIISVVPDEYEKPAEVLDSFIENSKTSDDKIGKYMEKDTSQVFLTNHFSLGDELAENSTIGWGRTPNILDELIMQSNAPSDFITTPTPAMSASQDKITDTPSIILTKSEIRMNKQKEQVEQFITMNETSTELNGSTINKPPTIIRRLRNKRRRNTQKRNSLRPRKINSNYTPRFHSTRTEYTTNSVSILADILDKQKTLEPESEHIASPDLDKLVKDEANTITKEQIEAEGEPSFKRSSLPYYSEKYDHPRELLVPGRILDVKPNFSENKFLELKNPDRGTKKFQLGSLLSDDTLVGGTMVTTAGSVEPGSDKTYGTQAEQNQCSEKKETCVPAFNVDSTFSPIGESGFQQMSPGVESQLSSIPQNSPKHEDTDYGNPEEHRALLSRTATSDPLKTGIPKNSNEYDVHDEVSPDMHEPTSRGRSISSADSTYESKRAKELSFDSPGSIEVHLDLNEDPGIDENNVEFDEEDVVPELEKKGKQFGFPGQAYNFLPLGPGPLLGGAPPPIRPEINSPRPSRGRYSYRPPQHIYDPVSYDDRYNFGYGVADDNTGTYFGQVENRQQGVTQGQYFVDLPDGRRLIVRYYADRTGYYPTITYEQKPGFYVTESPQQYPDYFNPVNGNRHPSSRYPVSADNSYLYNLGPGHGIVNDQHFADNHGFHFTSAGPDHSHDADGPVFGFDRRPISVSSSGIVPPSVIDTSTIPPNFGNSFSPSQPIYPFYLPTRYPYNPFFVFAAPGQIFSQVPFTSSSNPTFGLDQPSFASDKPASVPNFGINPTLVNREQRLNSFRPISNDKFGFLTRNSENEQHLTGTIEDQIKGSKKNSDFNRVGNDEVNALHGKTIASTLSFEETPDSFNEEY